MRPSACEPGSALAQPLLVAEAEPNTHLPLHVWEVIGGYVQDFAGVWALSSVCR